MKDIHVRPTRVLQSLLTAVALILLALPAGNARAQTTYSLFANSTPAVASVTNDFAAVELGVKFKADVSGELVGVRFYKGSSNTGTHVGHLWSAAGQLLATATFTNETATGWQEVTFTTPVPVTAGTTYVASYHAPGGAYAFTEYGLASGADALPLHALAGPANGGNGVFKYGPAGTFPTDSFHDSNYWVDVVFRPAAPVSLWPSTATPAVASVTNDSTPVELGVKFRTDVAGNVLGVRFYKGASNTGTHVGHLWSATGQLLATATFTSETATGWQQVTFSSPVTIAANTMYIASYHAPGGAYAFDNGGLASGVNAPPLYALPGTTSGGNGVFKYGPAGTFPTDSFQDSNYWVDVVFQATGVPPSTPPPAGTYSLFPATATPGTASANDTASVEMGVKFRADVDGKVKGIRFYKGASNTGTHVGNLWSSTGQNLASATFTNETASGWQQVSFATPVSITAGTTYVASYLAPIGGYAFDANGLANGVDAAPLHALPGTTSGGNGVFALGSASTFPNSSYQNANYWVDVVFEPNSALPRPGVTGSGPVLVATDPTNHFTDYLKEILKAEGITTFATTDAGNIGNTVSLNDYKVLILGEETLSAAQVTLVTNWVNAGGSLIAMRPAANLNALLGLNASSGTQDDGYLLIDTTQAPGAGITADTMQYHGTADLHTLVAGTRAVATLYSNATTPTAYAAVTLRTVGSGTAMAFTYDLAKSVILTRQGNPAWQGQNRDGSSIGPGARASDMFYGNASFDPKPDWVNLNKVQIPQADEQQRLLANMLHLTSAVPLPRLWYFPSAKKAVVVMTGDGHPGGAINQRWQNYLAASPAGCSVDDWQCIRGTVYDFIGGLTATQAQSYTAQGFEYALHVNTGCADYTATSLDPQFFTPQLAGFASSYPGIPAPVTNRTHCIAFSDWATQPKVSLAHGIRLDTNYYYWPDYWVQDRPGLFTGSGLAMRFADVDGTPIDVYQLATQMTDESGQSYPLHIDTLLANALGTKGYYGAFNANMHVDSDPSAGASGSAAIIASAQREGVSVITAKQLLTWLDAREATQVSSVAFTGMALTFTVATPARNLSLMVPTSTAAGRTLVSVTRNGSAVTTVPQTIKGVGYAFINGTQAGTYTVTYN
ncbi:DUF4082 domain-containing protein [Vitiosangium sp. GDMCC 1.1324]|uniref:DUF4082 domain-containing protein n=1 Tax=Vitiosangium sp. (strain GDMCC 1.1324) TaxID=2138576 RepID=UPI000D3B0D1A|nr:DUF4082 domain-containing protein [Vitiosangium sp. GDMCC 1.1324]PTL77303.1 hypothetical protein DAT35_45580 [Vitiosangium sp. GDMCC 1.1324]